MGKQGTKSTGPLCFVFLAIVVAMGLIAIISSSGGGGNDIGTPPSCLTAPEETRNWLTQEEMMSPEYRQSSPIHNGYFMPVGEELPAAHPFEGTL